jgi:hypothetical protein
LLPLLLALSSGAAAREDEVPFEPSAERFANAAACKARLVVLVEEARAQDHVAVQGPYDVSSGDVRAHQVLASGSGHRITEHRCLAEQLSSRTWRHSMDGAEADEPETIESMAAKAEWLKKPKSE